MTTLLLIVIALMGIWLAMAVYAYHQIHHDLEQLRLFADVIHYEVKSMGFDVRHGNLALMKALKGESYQGQFGGLDVHSSPNVPEGKAFIP